MLVRHSRIFRGAFRARRLWLSSTVLAQSLVFKLAAPMVQDEHLMSVPLTSFAKASKPVAMFKVQRHLWWFCLQFSELPTVVLSLRPEVSETVAESGRYLTPAPQAPCWELDLSLLKKATHTLNTSRRWCEPILIKPC